MQPGGAWTGPIPKELGDEIQPAFQVTHATVAGLRYGSAFLQSPNCVLQSPQLLLELPQHRVPLAKARMARRTTGKVLLKAALALITALSCEARLALATPGKTITLQALGSCGVTLTSCRGQRQTLYPALA